MRKNSSTSGCSALAAKNWRMSGVWAASLRAGSLRKEPGSWTDTLYALKSEAGAVCQSRRAAGPLLWRRAAIQTCPMNARLVTAPDDASLQSLSAQLGERLRATRHMLVTAESCTGGWIAKAVTDVPGSSEWFDCGLAAYSYEAKQALLGVRPETLERFGAVSRETVLEMVSGALVHSGASLSVAVTGIAGPGG